eukprot:gene5146-8752_t
MPSSANCEVAIGKSLKYFNEGFIPFIKKTFVKKYGDKYEEKVYEFLNVVTSNTPVEFDTPTIIKLIFNAWDEVFSKEFGSTHYKSYLHEVRYWRNSWAHQNLFSYEDCYRCLDTIYRLLRGNESKITVLIYFKRYYSFNRS